MNAGKAHWTSPANACVVIERFNGSALLQGSWCGWIEREFSPRLALNGLGFVSPLSLDAAGAWHLWIGPHT